MASVLLEWVQQRFFGDVRLWVSATIGQLTMEVKPTLFVFLFFVFESQKEHNEKAF